VASCGGSGHTSGIRSSPIAPTFYPEELLDDIKQAYAEVWLTQLHGLDDVKRDLVMGKDRILARLADDPHRRLVSDTVAEMGWWACFREDSQNRAKGTAQASQIPAESSRPSSPIKRATPKTGRNERCPCGSGKKYKKCCGV